MSEERRQWVCATLDVEGGERVAGSPTRPVSMGMAAKKKLWKPDSILRVRFLEGSPALHERVLQAASAWLVFGTLRQELTPPSRAATGASLFADLMPYVSPPPPPQAHPELVMAAVMAERRRRDMLRLERDDRLRARVLGPDPLG